MEAINVRERLPHEGKYVLVFLPNMPWFDSTDRKGAKWKVAKLVKGISKEEREILKTSKNPEDVKRSRYYESSDEDGNNKRDFCWGTFGADNYFGQDVTYWCELPKINN